MKRTLVVITLVLFAATAWAASPKNYQVTGPVLEVKDDIIVVQKGNEKWEIGKDKDTKVTGDPKVGSRVTIEYKMNAASIEVKDAAKKEAPAKKTETKKTETKK